MFGVILMLHFGSFHLLALAWQRTGVPVKPLMRAPLLATSLGDFWGARWNTGFHTLAHEFAFRPFSRRIGRTFAVLAVFLLSGLVHELVITLPARGGYGLPTAYFLVQGLGLVLERSSLGRTLALGTGVRGRAFALFVAAAPAFWLFPPVFVRNVILPMLHALGAT
jgi:alginate O-acetyltransferase complex protein AlgI